MAALLPQTIAGRYTLHELIGKGGMGAVYRASDRLTGETVALKQVLLDTGTDLSSTEPDHLRLSLSREFRTLAGLRHPHIISVLDYGFDKDRQPFFSMNLLEKPRTIAEAAQGKSLPEQIGMLLEMLQALSYLHRRGVIHRDLKPANVMVDRDDAVKLLDFGLALAARTAPKTENTIAGTIAYMSPELITDEIASPASDLYAVGVIACEMLQGRRPFNGSTVTTLLTQIIRTMPDLMDIDPSLRPVIERLLSKQPDMRYASADDTIRDLCEAAALPIPPETKAIRESFLQGAPFVGRDPEISQLQTALAEAITGKGSAWLIGGESGVGKSRLMEELRVYALVDGVTVLHGQGVANGGLPYQFWREPVRRLLISTEVTETDAAILKEIIPDISTLLGQEIPELPELEGRTGQHRLIGAIVSLFKQQKQPVVLLADDLQWAVESLEVLRTLMSSISDLPLLIVANYRDDEAPHLPRQLPNMRPLKLERLSSEAIAQLSVSMLGVAGERPQVVDLLERETEGNIFFLIEVVRALAEEAGRLTDIGLKTLPQKIFAGGIQQIVSRRLSKVPESARPLLNLAAVAGRQINLQILREATGAIDFEEWLVSCADAAVIESQEGEWRFVHDKLRDGIIATVAPNELRDLHQRIATAIEQVYPNAPEHWNALAQHWQQAGDETRERYYAIRAGEHQLKVGAYQDASVWLRRGMDLTDPADKQQLTYLSIRLGEAHQGTSDYKKAKSLLESALESAQSMGNERLAADALQSLGVLAVIQGDPTGAIDLFTRCLTAADNSGDRLMRTLTMAHLSELYTNRSEFEQAAQYTNDGLTLARELRDPRALSQTLRMEGKLKFTTGDYSGAKQSTLESLKIAQEIGDRFTIARNTNALGVTAATIGEYAEAQSHYTEALRIFHEIGDRWGTAFILNNLAFVELLMGHHIPAAGRFYEALAESLPIGVIPVILESMVGLARIFLEIQEQEQAMILLGLALNHPATFNDVRVLSQPAIDRLKTELGEEAYEAGLEKGKHEDVQALVNRLLANREGILLRLRKI